MSGDDNTGTITFSDEVGERDLRFLNALADLKMVGHVQPKQLLKQAYERVKMGGMSEVIFLHGESGFGKSKTAHTLRKKTKGKVKRDKNGYFVSGKFDQSSADPYSAILNAFSDICDKIDKNHHDEASKRKVQQNLRTGGSLEEDEVAMLIKLIPNLSKLVDVNESAVTSVQCSTFQAFMKFKLLCRKFVSAVATESQPIVLLLDDLQWADEGAIEIFESLCSDMESRHVLIVGSFRDGEDFGPPNNPEMILPCTDIRVQPLGANDVAKIVSLLLTEMTVEQTHSLSKVVYAKTRGNAHFVKLFLESLHSERLLTFSADRNKWEWDATKIVDETNDASNLLVAAKIERLNFDVQDVLKLASCLGYVFELSHLETIVVAEHANLTGKDRLPGTKGATPESSVLMYRDTLLNLLGKAIEHTVIVPRKQPGTFSFSHDRIFEAVYMSLPSGLERRQIHVRIGRLLLETYPTDEYVAFIAVDHLNRGASSIESQAERLNLVRLNLSTAKVAMEKSAFTRAQDYVVEGLSLFSSELWAIDYVLALDIHTTGARATVVGGSPEKYVEKIMLYGQTLQDKIPAYTSLIHFYGWQNRMDESIDTGLELLDLLGEKLPANPGKMHIAWEFALLKNAIGNKTDEELLSMPVLEDRTRMATITTLREIVTLAYFHKPNLMVIIILRSLRLSLRYGVSPEMTPSSFAGYGFVHIHMKKEEESLRFFNLALKMMKRYNSTYARATVHSVVFGLGLHVRTPIEEVYQPLVEGYLAGEKYGDTSHGLICATVSCTIQFMIGTPLGEVEKKFDRYIKLMKAYNKNGIFLLSCIAHQYVLTLMGRGNKDPTILTGSAMHQETFYRELKDSGNEVGFWTMLDHLFQLNCLFEDWNKARLYHSELEKLPEASKTLESHLLMRQHKFFSALFHSAWYRTTSNRKHKKEAHRILKAMKSRQTKGCPNYDGFILILDAELASSKGSKDETNSSFWRAVDGCKYVQLRALAHERAAIAMQERFGDRVLAKQHLEAAKRHYRQWQATAKVKDIEGKLKYL